MRYNSLAPHNRPATPHVNIFTTFQLYCQTSPGYSWDIPPVYYICICVLLVSFLHVLVADSRVMSPWGRLKLPLDSSSVACCPCHVHLPCGMCQFNCMHHCPLVALYLDSSGAVTYSLRTDASSAPRQTCRHCIRRVPLCLRPARLFLDTKCVCVGACESIVSKGLFLFVRLHQAEGTGRSLGTATNEENH